MIGLKYVGYKMATVEKRGMTIGELRHRIASSYLKKADRKIILLCLDDGVRLELNSMVDALAFKWSDSCKIEIINMPHYFGVIDENGKMDENAPLIFIIQIDAEETEDGTTII